MLLWEEGVRGVFSTKELARGKARKDCLHIVMKKLDDWIDEFILDEGME